MIVFVWIVQVAMPLDADGCLLDGHVCVCVYVYHTVPLKHGQTDRWTDVAEAPTDGWIDGWTKTETKQSY